MEGGREGWGEGGSSEPEGQKRLSGHFGSGKFN